MHRSYELLAAGLTAVLLAGAPLPASAAGGPTWATGGHDAENTGWNPGETGLVPATMDKIAPGWSIAATGTEVCARQSAPVLGGGRLFLTGREGVGGYDGRTGRRLWTFRYADPMDTYTPLLALSGRTLLVASSGCQSASDPDGMLTALDTATGRVRWHLRTDSPDATLIVSRGVVVVGGEDAGGIATTAVNLATGAKLWQRPRAMPANGVSAHGVLLLTTTQITTHDTNGAVAVDIATGRPRWRTGEQWSVLAATPDGTSFLVGDAAGALLKVNARTGTTEWTRPGLAGAIAVDDTHVYVSRVDGEVHCLELGTGRRDWHHTGFHGLLRPVVAGHVLYLVEQGRRLVTRNAATGRALPFVAAGKPIDHAVVAGGRIYLTDGSMLRTYTG
ncbi:MAG: outer membrane protein assembly factor BamB [Actinoplanes sp.]|jgi:outer membrane protein assembly factor BamB|nr:outer membrane protein assembly factor BamB [Actinoplanes sp.]